MPWNWVNHFALSLLFFVSLAPSEAQSNRGVLVGRVTDPTHATIPAATVEVTTPLHTSLNVTTDAQGSYRITDLDPGMYEVNATAPGFISRARVSVEILAGQTATLDIALNIAMEQQNITVTEEPAAIETSPANNASATILEGKALESLSTDPDELQQDLMALAGAAIGPNAGQLFVDGFSSGQPPPKSAIREIRINQNPFSARYDKPGHGRIEILTKPGADRWHGNVEVGGNDQAFNSQNPFLKEPPPGYYSITYDAEVGGPLSKKASFFFDLFRRNIEDLAVIDTPGDVGLNIPAINLAVANPKTRMNLNPRLDYQLTQTNILTVQYQYWRNSASNSGLGQYSLPSMAYDALGAEHTLRVSDSQTVGANIVNEARFQFERDINRRTPRSTLPTINVQGYFNGGGNSQGITNDRVDRYQFRNHTSVNHQNHQLGFGFRLRRVSEQNYSTSGFNGTFIFNSAANYFAGNPYQFTQTVLLPSGSPNTGVSLFDVGLYVQDDWRVRPNITLSGGLRFESQTAIHDWADWAPRIGLSWGIGGKESPKTVLRAGWGMFYDRFTEDLLLNAARLNGIRQQSYVLYGTAASPLSFYPNLPSPQDLQNAQISTGTTYRISSALRAPYVLQSSISVERELTKGSNLSITYINSRGSHQFYTNNVNAPRPNSFNYLDPTSLAGDDRPNGINENIFEYESDGIFKQNQLLVNGNIRVGKALSVFTNYTLNSAHSDAVGPNSFPSNPYNILEDYGRAPFDIRNRFFLGGMISLPHAIELNPFLVANSGRPYNIVLSQDLNGSTVLNQRPAFATSVSDPANVVTTSAGAFDTVPVQGESLVPYNYLTGPSYVSLNLRVSKTFGFGGEKPSDSPSSEGASEPAGQKRSRPKATDRRYQMTFSVAARNIFNEVNPGTPAAILDPPHADPAAPNTLLPASASPFFAIPNSLANGSTANRTLYLQAGFSF